jgi:branched-chain amino acid aminotransferase
MLQSFNERNRNLIVNIGGELVHREKAGISPFDSTVQNGDGVWEGLRLYDGRIFRLHEHLDRLRLSAQALAYKGIPTDEEIIKQIRRTLAANGMRDGVHIRLTLSRGLKYTSGLDPRINTFGTMLIVLAEHKPPVYDKSGLRLITAEHRRPPADVLDQNIHSCNQITSILAKIEANRAGADDALMLDTRGFVAETNATHVFIVRDGIVLTPHTVACPEGITRAAVLELCRDHDIAHEVRDLTVDEVYEAQEMFCTGTMGELAAVVEVDGKAIGDGTIGPMTRRLSELFTQLTATEGVQVIESR